MATKMINIDAELEAWCFYRFARSGALINLQEMDPVVREETVRTIRMEPLPGIAYDKDMNAIANNGALKSDSPGDDNRHYTADELTAFNIKFLQTLAAKRKIDVPKGTQPDRLITLILEWQHGIPSETTEPSTN